MKADETCACGAGGSAADPDLAPVGGAALATYEPSQARHKTSPPV